jgi:hypothetical protein
VDKILIQIYLPAASRGYDVYIPLKSKLHEVMTLLSNTLTELSEGYYTVRDNSVICDKTTGKILDINMSAEELSLKNGSKLILI